MVESNLHRKRLSTAFLSSHERKKSGTEGGTVFTGVSR